MSHYVHLADCICGCKMFVLDSERGAISSLKKYQVRRAAKKLNRHFVDTHVSRQCPKCKTEIDLTKPDERWVAQGGEMIREG